MKINLLRKRVLGGFSLLELMVVISIAVIFMSLAVHSVSGLRGSFTSSAGQALMTSVIDQARSYALANNALTYIAFSDKEAPFPSEKVNNSFAIFVDRGIDEDPEQITEWKSLPGDMHFESDATDSIFTGDKQEFGIPDDKSAELSYFAFAPDGSLQEPRQPQKSRITLNSGKYANHGDGYEIVMEISPVTGRVVQRAAAETL